LPLLKFQRSYILFTSWLTVYSTFEDYCFPPHLITATPRPIPPLRRLHSSGVILFLSTSIPPLQRRRLQTFRYGE